MYGIQTDTDKYEHATPMDFEAYEFIVADADLELIEKIDENILSKKILRRISEIKKSMVIYRGWLIGGIGFIDEGERDTIAIIADFFAKKGDYDNVVVFAAVEKSGRMDLVLDVSFRTENENLDLKASDTHS